MSSPPKEGGSFSPVDLEAITQALERAIALADGDTGGLADVPAAELKRRLACIILAEAERGSLTAADLARIAVFTLRRSTIARSLKV